MIRVQLNRQNFEYDVHSLVKAFYPREDVLICYTAPGTEPERSLEKRNHPGEDEKKTQTIRIAFGVAGRTPTDREDHPAMESAPADGEDHPAMEPAPADGEDHPAMEPAPADGEDHPAMEPAPADGEDHPAMEPADGEDRPAMEPVPADNTVSVQIVSADGLTLASGAVSYDPQLDRKKVKNVLKRLLYQVLRDCTGEELPWGNLTGIRPVKIPMALLEQGWRNAEIAAYMRETYDTSREKTALAIAIANRERHILKDINYQNGYSLYVGIPFCPSICLYCSFSSSPLHLWRDRVDEYLDALCREISCVSGMFAGKELNTVYIGGGTPTTLEPYQLERLLTVLKEHFPFDRALEFTVEAGRPDSITREKLEVLRRHNVTRISINPQTMNQKTLDLIGRQHTVEQTKEAFALARSLGFDNINMDLIVGLPGEGQAEVEHTMQEVLRLDPDSITVHSLAVKRAARLRLFREEHRDMTFVNSREIMDLTARYTSGAGHFPYYLYRQKNMAGNFENVGYAKEGKAGIYNILIMEEVQSILALGAGASTKLVEAKDQIRRIENVKDIRNYIERIDEMIERKRQGLHE